MDHSHTRPVVTLSRGAAVVATGSALVLVACMVYRRPVNLHDPSMRVAAALVVTLGVLTILSWWCAHRLANRTDVEPGAHDIEWRRACLLTCALGAIGLLGVGLLALFPPRTAASAYKAWSYLDKRWLVASYLLTVGLVYAPGVLRRAFAPGASTAQGTAVAGPTDEPEKRPARTALLRAAAMIALAWVLATLYVAPLVPDTLTRVLDTHELVHLGPLQRISQGALPYIGARTQYGPGHQVLTYEMMRASEFTVRGFRAAHLLLNWTTIALLFSVTLLAFGWMAGLLTIAVALFVSPLQVTTFAGWGILARWFAPFLAGAVAPLLLWREVRPMARLAAFAMLGIVCGAFAWFGQENGAMSVVTTMLVLAAAVIRRAIPIRSVLVIGAVFVAALAATLLILLAWTVGPAHLDDALTLYRSGSQLVFNGITNTAWSNAETAWSSPSSAWKRAYYLTPVLVLIATCLALYPLRGSWIARNPMSGGNDVANGQFIGMLAAGASLGTLALFRADAPHFIATAMAIPAMMVLGVLHLPRNVVSTPSGRWIVRVALMLVLLFVYPFGYARPEFKFRDAADPVRQLSGMTALRDVWYGTAREAQPSSLLDRRLGFLAAPEQPCCRFTKLTYAELAEAMRDIHAVTAGRRVYVDTLGNYSALGAVASSVYFLGDLRVGTAFAEPMMSIWVDDDIAASKEELRKSRPECLVTGGREFLLTPFLLDQLKDYTEASIPARSAVRVYCEKSTRAG